MLGCIPNKTFKLEFPKENQVPFYLINHFIRGYFDGDGCVRSLTQKTKSIGIQILGNEEFIENLQKILKESNIESKINNVTNSKVKNIVINKIQESIKFKEFIYEDATIYLERKYLKFKEWENFYENRKKTKIN